ncbi:hypothetical protein [Halorubrum halophilum]|uniref:hypothetical protein n=1 Tax=Halorubrum halophilum TaxID=413816 RepID=UPI0006787366|nr:hypothetical protein [Halorubrum halophilum]
MLSYENRVVAGAGLAAVLCLGAVTFIELRVGFPGDWASVVAFVLFMLFGFAIPQVYLLRADPSVSRVSRMGVITLMLIVLASVFSTDVTGVELTVIWGIVGVSVAAIFVYEVRDGYLQSLRNET